MEMENKSYKEVIASKLVELREDKGFTQDDLANKTHLSRGQISMYEAAKRLPSIEVLDHLAKFFDVHIGYFVGDDKITTKEALRKEELNRLERDILSDPSIPESTKLRLVTKIRGLNDDETPSI